MNRVEGKVALVTGGASGLGKATAQMLVREGARVVVTDRNEAGGREVAASLGQAGIFVKHDVTREEEWVQAIERTMAHFGRLDVLVNNAGISIVKDVETLSLEEWRLVHAVNLDGVFLGCKHGIGAMHKSQARGSIINMSSTTGMVGTPAMPAYSSSKAGVRLLTKSVALHCARKGYNIRCNSIHPTLVETPLLEDLARSLSSDTEAAKAQLKKMIPMGRFGKPEDIAHAVIYLASDESSLMTGSELVIDGGNTAQ